jgi:hypothetical protein
VTRLDVTAMRSCPICGWRDIVTSTRYEGRWLPCCEVCHRNEKLAGCATSLSVGARAVRMARSCPGLTSTQICDELGVLAKDRIRVAGALHAAIKAGVVKRDGRAFYPTDKHWAPSRLNTGRRLTDRRAA